jgi:hypothetical protein
VAIDYTTDAGRVRMLATDTDETSLIFTDAQIEGFLAVEYGSVLLGAAQALDTIASSKALLAKKVQIGGLKIDETSVAKSLHERAESLREQARTGDPTVSHIDVIDFDPNAWLYQDQ